MLQTGRNPFARETIRREVIDVTCPHGPDGEHLEASHCRTCAWCGRQASYLPHGKMIRRGRLFRYVVDPDAGRSSYIASGRLFCSIGCARNYTDH